LPAIWRVCAVISRKLKVNFVLGYTKILIAMDDILLVDKPKGLTSSRVVELIRKELKVKAGHTGTLDPIATGLLIVLMGRRTKEASSFLTLDKSYEVKARLGVRTDTFDCDGKILQQSDATVTKDELQEVLKGFRGEIWQVPPPFSAKKLAGHKAYELARKGVSVQVPPKKVSIYSFKLEEFQFPYFTFACDVSSGFYVRSLVHDIGTKLAVGAIVVEVRRTRVGHYRVEQAKKLEDILSYKV
jgi:tRNA pseudouridine55 synthase